jgi:cell division protein FtsX
MRAIAARTPLATAFTVLVIAIALTLPSSLGLAILSVRTATGDFANAVNVSVFFKQDVALDKARQLAASLRERNGVASVRLVSKEEAYKSFRQSSGFGEALDALGENPLPHALDLPFGTWHRARAVHRAAVVHLRRGQHSVYPATDARRPADHCAVRRSVVRA